MEKASPHETDPLLTQAEPAPSEKDPNEPVDLNIPDNYVSHTLRNTKELPPITWDNWHKNVNYLSLTILTVTPLLALIGLFTVPIQKKTFWFSVLYYYITGLGKSVSIMSVVTY
jgi:stearoyl-CoA desaturase (delta-9 desaturase)